METTNKNIPALRFPEFNGEWETKKVGSICDFIVPGRNKPTNFEGNIPWITTPDIIHNTLIYFSKSGLNISKEEAKKIGSKVVPPNSVIISCVGELGLVAITGKEIVINQQLHAFIPKSEIYYRFLLYSLSIQKKYMEKVATKTAVLYMNKDNCNSIPVTFPTIHEQQKIASFLTAVDDKIQQLQKKKALLEEYKKGVMQQIFSQQLRFKDDEGNDYPEWEKNEFGKVFTFINSNSFSRIQLTYLNGLVKNIHYGDIHTKFKSNFDITKENVPFINTNIDISNIRAEQYCQKGDIIIADASEDYKDVGKTIEIINNGNQKILAGLHTFIARSEKIKFAIGFLGYLMQTFNVRLQIMKLATGISVLGISKTNLSKILIIYPSFDEQRKITAFLSSIDNQIDLVQAELHQTQNFKKGLLQQMFV